MSLLTMSRTKILLAHLFLVLNLFVWTGCVRPLYISSKGSLLSVTQAIQEDSSYVAFIAPYKIQLDEEMQRVIGMGARELNKVGGGETTLGNLVADMQKAYSEKKFNQKIDISIINNGGMRNIIPEGDITIGNIYELSPFENFIYLLELTSEDVEKLAEYAVRLKNLGISGMQIESEKGELKRFAVGGKAVEKDQTYLLAINDYLANGGDYMDFLVDVPRILESDVLLREMLIEQVEEWTLKGKLIDAEIEGRQKLN